MAGGDGGERSRGKKEGFKVISIRVIPHGGSIIDDVFLKSCAVADILGVAVEFDFNDYTCHAYYNGTGQLFWKYKPGWESGVAGWYRGGKVEYSGRERKRIKPLDTLPPTAP